MEVYSKGKWEAENPLEDCNAGLQKKKGFKIQHVNYLSEKKKKQGCGRNIVHRMLEQSTSSQLERLRQILQRKLHLVLLFFT